MNHRKQYDLLIRKANLKSSNGYVEKHHVIPKALGGSNSKSNIILLTAREHFVAHMLLAQIHGGGMWQAALMMKQSPKWVSRKTNSRLYAICRREWAAYLSGRKRPPHIATASRKANAGRIPSAATRAKMSLARKGKPRCGDPAKFKHSEVSKGKMSRSQKLRRTGCVHGHEFTPENTYLYPDGTRGCRTCNREYQRELRAMRAIDRIPRTRKRCTKTGRFV